MGMDDFRQSAAYLKQVVPLMMKYQIPATPCNYTLWYTYVSEEKPELNRAIDEKLQDTGLISEVTCNTLYQAHVEQESQANMEQLRQSLEAMTSEMFHTMKDTLSDTDDFQNMLNKRFASLEHFEEQGMSLDETVGVIRELVSGSAHIQKVTSHFHKQLAEAQQEIEQLRNALQESRKQASHDALTQLLNRRSFDQELESFHQQSQLYSLVLVDIDHFKAFNDEYGHQLGDLVLKMVARRLQDSCKEGIQAYRYGGEEFALVAPGKKLMVARQFAESVRRGLEKLSIQDRRTGKKVDKITASFGVAEFSKGDTVAKVIERADEQLYKAKELGRNRVMPISV
ncbi:GGDEF domain-containing protein [Dongshaea marina]|uniref:GGDEF domain-containing protein n=1 Tax=Dongshaea marina TaxID=2047966 RepID=UPI000D3E7AC7|nr:GGDEF domain-containing protein [Dongshaea marina]